MEADTSTTITADTATTTRRAHTPINVNIPAGQLQPYTQKNVSVHRLKKMI